MVLLIKRVLDKMFSRSENNVK